MSAQAVSSLKKSPMQVQLDSSHCLAKAVMLMILLSFMEPFTPLISMASLVSLAACMVSDLLLTTEALLESFKVLH